MAVRAVVGRVNRNVTRRIVRAERTRAHSIPAPVRGWNARDALANMREDEATALDNFFPDETAVRVRRGYAEHATDIGASVESLMSWSGPSSRKLFAAAGANIFDVTSDGDVGSAAIDSLTNARWQHTMFSNSAGSYLYIVNGADAPRHYDGTNWATPSLTGSGLTVANLIHVNAFKGRLFFIEKDSLSFWYLPVENIAGTLTEFDLGPRCALGGHLVAMGTWTRDGGSGMDDYAAFVTSMGEVVVFQGLDPGDAAAWSLVGVFRIGAPLGRRCMKQVGPELVIMGDDGFSTLSRFLTSSRVSERAAMSNRITNAVLRAVRSNRTRFGWQPVFYPAGNMIFFNIPQPNGNVQFVSNATTGAWCRFTGMNAECWENHDDKLFFGGDGVVYRADHTDADDGDFIHAQCETAYSYFGSRGRKKKFSMARPNFTSDGAVRAAMAVMVDFQPNAPTATPTFTAAPGAEWDDTDWDVADWTTGERTSGDWLSVAALGTAAALNIRTRSRNGVIYWNATDWLYELAGHI